MGQWKTILIVALVFVATILTIVWSGRRLKVGDVQKRISPVGIRGRQLPKGPYNQKECWCSHPKTTLKAGSFQGIGGTSETNGRQCVLAFSAYFDRRNRTVAIVTDSDISCYQSVKIGCFLWYENYINYYATDVTLGYITTTVPGETPRIGVIYYCDTPAEIEDMPYAVSFLPSGTCSGQSSCLAMMVVHPKPPTYQFTVCVPPIFGNPRPGALLEFVEMHRLLGAEKFYFYNESIPESWDTFLHMYQRLGIVQVVQWHSVYPDIVLYHNQQIMQDDCMYRNMYQTQYVAQMDIDELLMTMNNWSTVIHELEKNDTAAFMFLNRFYLDEDDVVCDLYQNSSVRALKALERQIPYFQRLAYEDSYYGPDQRSKLLYRPEKLQQVCTHHAVPLNGFQTMILEKEVGVLKHYRVPPLFASRKSAIIVDRSICLYEERLIRAMRAVMELSLQEPRERPSAISAVLSTT